MNIIDIIQKKRDCGHLTRQEINYVVKSYVDEELPDYQIAAFLMATFINGMNDEELSWLTDAMLFSGEVIVHKKDERPLIDKHSTGGIGDKISIPLAPALAACGLRVPMIAGRGLGHTGGTLDKLEAIPGFRASLSSEEYQAQVDSIGCVIMGQTKSIAPADKKLYALRDVTGTVESIPLIASSIMSKKLAEGIDGLVLDVKFGSGAFMRDLERAKLLAKTIVMIGKNMGKKVTALLTNMDQPLGVKVGNSLEIVESIDILRGQGPKDSTALTVELGAEMLLLGAMVKNLDEGRQSVNDAIASGRAFTRFVDMVRAQGGDERVLLEPSRFRAAKNVVDIVAKETGYVEDMNSRAFGHAVSVMGGGRLKLSDVIDVSVGIEINVKIGDKIERGQLIGKIFANDKGLDEAREAVSSAIKVSAHSVEPPLLIKDRITSEG